MAASWGRFISICVSCLNNRPLGPISRVGAAGLAVALHRRGVGGDPRSTDALSTPQLHVSNCTTFSAGGRHKSASPVRVFAGDRGGGGKRAGQHSDDDEALQPGQVAQEPSAAYADL